MRPDEVIYTDATRTITRVFSAAGWSDVTTWAPGCEPPEIPDLVAEAREAVDEDTPAPIVALLDSLP